MRITIKIPGSTLIASHAARAGIVAAAANVSATFARGLLPRSVSDQAVITGVCSAAMFQAATTAHSAAETLALLTSGDHGMRGREPDLTRTLVADLSFVAVGAIVDQLLPPRSDEPLAISGIRFVAETLMLGGAAGAVVIAVDGGLARLFPGDALTRRPIIVDVGLGAIAAGTTVYLRHRNAKHYGLVDPQRRAIKKAGPSKLIRAGGFGLGAAAGMTALVAGEQFVAHSIKNLLDRRVRRFDIGSPLIGHAAAFTLFSAAGFAAYAYAKRHLETSGDIVEPAYPEPPTNPNVTAGPRSVIEFDTIGKEGRRFVLMALTSAEIAAVMQEPASDPVRIVGGFEAARDTEELAQLIFHEMKAVGAFDKSLICIASPTGVGYVSYCFAESLEYLTRGDCAIIVPQYALVPSAMALFDTQDGAALQRRVLELTRDEITSMPTETRPRLVQFGESLGAQVAMDVAYPGGMEVFDRLGVSAGLYMGVPFRTKSWLAWRAAPQDFDPKQRLVGVAQPSDLPAGLRGEHAHPAEQSRHVMVIHDDDPVNKFSYALVIRPPWWLGAPTTRPPKVPRETIWRPVTTFMLTVIDLFNGMDFKPGEFKRRGHDYRIDSCDATSATYGLPVTAEQSLAIDEALRVREQDWAARRLVARKFAGARASIKRTLKSWGVSPEELVSDGDGAPLVADIDPHADLIPKRLGSSGVV